MTENPHSQSYGLLASLTTFASTLLAVASTRLDLFFLDLEEDREHFLRLAITALVTLFCLGVGVVLVTILVVVSFWDDHRVLVLGILAGLFLFSGATLAAGAYRKMKSRPRLFAASLAELKKDSLQLAARR